MWQRFNYFIYDNKPFDLWKKKDELLYLRDRHPSLHPLYHPKIQYFRETDTHLYILYTILKFNILERQTPSLHPLYHPEIQYFRETDPHLYILYTILQFNILERQTPISTSSIPSYNLTSITRHKLHFYNSNSIFSN